MDPDKIGCKERRICADLLYIIHQTNGIQFLGVPHIMQKVESGGTSDDK